MGEIVFVFDFDHTLLESLKSHDVLKRAFIDTLGVFAEDFDSSAEKCKNEYGFYFPLLHVRLLSKDDEDVRKGMRIFEAYYNSIRECVFDEVVDVLEKLKGKGKLVLLTFGSREHQLRKVWESGLWDYFDFIRVVEEKSVKEIEKCLINFGEVDLVYSIGDRPSDSKDLKEYGLKNDVKVMGVRIRRKEGKYFDEEDEGYVDEEYGSLREFVDGLDK